MTKSTFSTSWKASIQPGKQRKFRYEAPLHIRQKFVHVHLSPELRTKYNTRNVQVKKGDKIKVLKGTFKKKEGKVERVILKQEKIFVTGLENIKKDGNKVPISFKSSNLMIIELNLNDKKRKQKLEKIKSPLVEKSSKKDAKSESKKTTENKSKSKTVSKSETKQEATKENN